MPFLEDSRPCRRGRTSWGSHHASVARRPVTWGIGAPRGATRPYSYVRRAQGPSRPRGVWGSGAAPRSPPADAPPPRRRGVGGRAGLSERHRGEAGTVCGVGSAVPRRVGEAVGEKREVTARYSPRRRRARQTSRTPASHGACAQAASEMTQRQICPPGGVRRAAAAGRRLTPRRAPARPPPAPSPAGAAGPGPVRVLSRTTPAPRAASRPGGCRPAPGRRAGTAPGCRRRCPRPGG